MNASNVNRLSLSIGDLASMLEETGERGYGIDAVNAGLNTKTPVANMVFQMLGVAAEYESAMNW